MNIANREVLWFLFFLVPGFPLLFLVYRCQKRNFLLLGGQKEKLEIFSQSFLLYWLCVVISHIFIILAWSDISFGYRFVRRNFTGLQVVVVMDISNSMRATDIPPSRLKASVKVAKNLIYGLSSSQIGIVFFKGDSFVASPLTRDKLFLTGIFTHVQPAMLTTKGTNIASGLLAAQSLFSLGPIAKKVVVLFSDGAELSGNLLSVIRELNVNFIPVIAVGMASQEGAEIQSFSPSGNPVFSKIEENSLKIAAKGTNGKYFLYQNNVSKELLNYLKDYTRPFRHLEKIPNRLSSFFVAFALIGFLISIWLRNTQWKRLYTIT